MDSKAAVDAAWPGDWTSRRRDAWVARGGTAQLAQLLSDNDGSLGFEDDESGDPEGFE
jgi:hypothetical protein